jgi:agmatinase
MSLSSFNQEGANNFQEGIFGLPLCNFNEARLVILPIPWEATVIHGSGTARAAEPIVNASRRINLFNPEFQNSLQKNFYIMDIDKKILAKSDYLRKEAGLVVDYIAQGEDVNKNSFIGKSISDINQGGEFLNNWAYENTSNLLKAGKLVAVLGGDHSAPFGYIKALAERNDNFGILQIDAQCSLRKARNGFVYSHASALYNILNEIPQVTKLVQIGVRDFSEEEWNFIQNSNGKISLFLDETLKERVLEGETWQNITDEIIAQLPQNVYINFDVDGLDPKYCPSSGTPAPGGFEVAQVFYLIKKILTKGKKIIGFDLVDVGSDTPTDAIVGARILWRLCNWFMLSNN